VQAPRPKGPPLRLHREGTYVIAGGLGDLGKRIGRYLIEHGAGHIVALSRRKVDPEQRANLEESFSKLGGTLHIVQCDICNEDSALAAAKAIAALPPVRGVIQSTLVLRDHPLEYMELDDWHISMNPKVWGTRNLNRAFSSPQETDFFIMLSSVCNF
jgi:NAD(P)-dependent dehydrogenase (short-subunit alcohol dehydrogenase family)